MLHARTPLIRHLVRWIGIYPAVSRSVPLYETRTGRSTTQKVDLAKHLGCIFTETSTKQPFSVDQAPYSAVPEIRKYN